MNNLQRPACKIVIGIPSFKRPAGLERCLRTIEAQICDVPDAQITVIVAENDLIDRAAMAVVARLAPNFRFRLHGYLSNRRGISAARNVLLEHGFGTHKATALAMLDDDQWIEPDWLQNMIGAMDADQADVVDCPVLADFMGVPPRWLHQLPIFQRKMRQSGPIPLIYGAGGVLLARRIMEIMPTPEFSEYFTLLGGEDTDFFMHLKNAGGRFSHCAAAISHEGFPVARQTVTWARRRAERISMTMTLLTLRHSKRSFEIGFVMLGMVDSFITNTLLLAAFFWHPLKREIAICGFCRIRGQVRALTGKTFEMYR